MLNKILALLLSAGLLLSPLNAAVDNPSAASGELTANVAVSVGKQQAVYEKWTAEQDTCSSCTGSGFVMTNTRPLVSCRTMCWCRAMAECPAHANGGGGGSTSCGVLVQCTNILKHPDRRDTCVTCSGSGKSGYIKGGYLSDVTANKDSLPQDGRHTDGYWYVFKKLVED